MWPKLEFVGCYVGYVVNTYTNMHSLYSLSSNIIMSVCFYMQKYIKFEEATKLGYIHLKTCQTSYGNYGMRECRIEARNVTRKHTEHLIAELGYSYY